MFFSAPPKYQEEVSHAEYQKIAREEFEKINDKLVGDAKLDKKPYSDIIERDTEGNIKYQYINLIQEGGGVWGISLVGYTYILEMAGIRFLKTAGTSAGAINTLFLAAMPNPIDGTTKSDAIVKLLSNLKTFKFIDGHWMVQKLIKNLITNDDYAKQAMFSLTTIILAAFGLLFTTNILQWTDINLNRIGIVIFFIVLIVSIFASIRGKKRSDKDRVEEDGGKDDPIDVILKVKKDATPKTSSFFQDWGYVIASSIALVLFFSSGYFFNCQDENCVQFIDLGIILFIIIAVLLLHDKLDRDLLTVGSLLFVLVPIFAYGTGTLNETFFYTNKWWIIGLSIVGVIAAAYIFNKNHRWVLYLIIIICLFFCFALIAASLPKTQYSRFSYLSIVAITLCTILVTIVGGFGLYLFKKFKTNEFGINPGDYFHEWLKENLKEYNKGNDYLLNNLMENWEANVENIKIRNREIKYKESTCETSVDELKKFNIKQPPVVFISSEITTQNKVEFPKMCNAYWQPDEKIYVADFVRASMAIPFFFEPYKREGITPQMNNNGKEIFGEEYASKPFDKAYFVDGGVLSNFPYNIFHNPAVKNARMPTFGVRLNDSSDESHEGFKSIGHYIGTLFNTSRYYYDRDFLIKNPYYRKCIKTIDMKGFNWLNFFLTGDERKEMFRLGAKSACEFLASFEWEKFRKERDKGIHQICNCDDKDLNTNELAGKTKS